MENSLKQRIVGAVVLIALAVIFLPSILKEKDNQLPFKSKIPERPKELVNNLEPSKQNEKDIEIQKALDQLETRTSERKSKQSDSDLQSSEQQESPLKDENLTQPNENVKKSETLADQQMDKGTQYSSPLENEKTQVIDDDPIATIGAEFAQAAWVIQIASFSNKENALNFVEKLKTAGHKAYYRNSKDQNAKQTLYRIYVGPYIEKQSAQSALVKINKLSSLSGIILAFDPVKH